MARTPKLYQKLSRRRGSMGAQTSLWLGPDHVLVLEGTFFTESYQRVFLRDVQGLFIRPCAQAKWVTFVSLGLLVLFGGLMALGGEAMPVFGFLGILALIVLIFGLLAARNCRMHVVTAVQCREWPSVVRYRQARKIIKRLTPLIREAQAHEGKLPADLSVNSEPAVSMQA